MHFAYVQPLYRARISRECTRISIDGTILRCKERRYWTVYGQEEFKNANPFLVQKAHKAVLAGQYLRSLYRSIVASMEIRVHSRLILARYKGCTNAMCILSRSYGHEEFKNTNHFSVQKSHKTVHAGKYLLSLHRSIVPSMVIRVHS